MRNPFRNRARITGRLLLLSAASLLTLSACDGAATVYHHSYHSVPPTGWLSTDTLCFEATITDSAAVLSLSLEVRHRTGYPYQTLPVVLTCISTDSTTLFTDTLTIRLTDATGRWSGEGLSGLYQYGEEVKQMQTDRPGRYGFQLHHAIGSDTVNGINDVGLRIEKLQ